MNRLAGPGLLIIAVVGFLLVGAFVFTVDEREQAIVLRFGDPVRVQENAGLNFKIPIENVIYLDKRNLRYNVDSAEIFTVNQERLVVDAFVRYRINEPLRYYESFRQGGAGQAVLRLEGERRLAAVVESSLRRVLGGATDTAIIRDERAPLMQQITNATAEEAQKFGVSIIDVQIRRADFPPENEDDVYERMRSERVQIAQQIRAEGEEQARIITAQADRVETEIIARANQRALQIQGQADATRNCIFAGAYDGARVVINETAFAEPETPTAAGAPTPAAPADVINEEAADADSIVEELLGDNADGQIITCEFQPGAERDPQRAEFFAFSRSLLAYEESLRKGETTILLSPDSEFFRYFNDFEAP
ncbi:MAG: protease modulator HflC [Pseudomonadota bacterium]